MKKIFLSALLMMGGALISFAKPVSTQTAQKVAKHFLESKLPQGAVQLSLHQYEGQKEATQPALYVFANTLNPGFVIVAGDDAVQPILAYSDENPFAIEGEAFSSETKYWIDQYIRQIEDLLPLNLEAEVEIASQWDRWLQDGAIHREEQRPTAVSPMVLTKWGQWPVYNLQCPISPNPGYNAPYNQVPTGCVATAMAQIMKFWDYPSTGAGSKTYNNGSIGGTLSANFGATTYNWSNMPNTLLNGNTITATQSQIDEVARLMFHAGVSVEMNYTARSSGAYVFNYSGMNNPSAQRALVNNFKYSNRIYPVARDGLGTTAWIQLLEQELNNGRPFLYTGYDPNGAGHVWVVDGFNATGFHMNWGWKGVADGYYTVADLRPSTVGAGGGLGSYNDRQGILINIKPQGNNSPDPQIPASFNLQVGEQSFQSSDDTIRVGDAYQFSALINNTGGGEFSANDFNLYLLALKDARQNNSTTIDLQNVTIPGNGSFTYHYNTASMTELNPGYYLMVLIYTPTNSNSGVPITNSRNQWLGYPLYVLSRGAGIEKIESDQLVLYPNPARQMLHVSLKNKDLEMKSFRLYDQTGRLIKSDQHLSGQELNLSLDAIANGIYSLDLTTNKGAYRQQIVIQK